MKKLFLILVTCAVLLLGWWFLSIYTARPPLLVVTTPAPSEDVEEPLSIRYPIPEAREQKLGSDSSLDALPTTPLPVLDDSDGALHTALTTLVEAKPLDELFISENSIRRIAATVDNLTDSKLPLRLSPFKLPARGFLAEQVSDGKFLLSPDNYPRYAKYVALFESLDSRRLGALYMHFYPLFQEAYEELGYPERYFNDRVVTVIDHLLAAPEVEGPIKLVRPKVFFQFSDPELEALSAGQKVLIRIGPENATRIKRKLQELRNEITGQRYDSQQQAR